MKIGDLAKKTGCKVVTIRYYEKEGLLQTPQRSGSNYRIYSQKDLDRLEFIMHCRKHDIKLEEIKKLLAFRDKPQHDCSWVGELIDKHIKSVDEQIASLAHLKNHLKSLRKLCRDGHSGAKCGILKGLSNACECCSSCEKC